MPFLMRNHVYVHGTTALYLESVKAVIEMEEEESIESLLSDK